jgi:hypothetical protein
MDKDYTGLWDNHDRLAVSPSLPVSANGQMDSISAYMFHQIPSLRKHDIQDGTI